MSEVVVAPKRGRQVAAVQPSAPAPLPTDGGVLGLIAAAAVNPAVDVEKMRALFDLQERAELRQDERALTDAIALVSAKVPRVKKNGRVDLGKDKGGYDFAKWEDMDRVLRPMIEKAGLSLSFDVEQKEGGGAVIVGIVRLGIASKSVRVPLALDTGAGRNNLQAMGSTISYGKRYCAEMLFNIVREGADDDGAAGGRETISDEQVAKLRALIAKTPRPEAAFLGHMKVGRIEDIPAHECARAEAAIWTVIAAEKRKAAEEADAALTVGVKAEVGK